MGNVAFPFPSPSNSDPAGGHSSNPFGSKSQFPPPKKSFFPPRFGGISDDPVNMRAQWEGGRGGMDQAETDSHHGTAATAILQPLPAR